MKVAGLKPTWLDVLLVAVPIGIVLEVMHANPATIFVVSCIAIIPLAGWMGKATEHLAGHYGPGVGGLLNASFGNAAELIIAIMALRAGYIEVVKASITGSIIGNVLLVLGLSFLCGGLKHKHQTFNARASGLGTTLLLLSAIGLLVPATFHMLAKDAANEPALLQTLSRDIAIVLFLAYGLSLVFQLITHQHLFTEGDHKREGELWSKGKAMIVLLIATVFVAFMSEFLVGSVEHTAETWGMTEVFVGVILVAIIGNAAEHSSAVLMALKNKMDLSITIAVGSGIQIALFVAPLLLFLSYWISPEGPMNLVFTPFEIIAVVMSVIVVESVANDGESHWMEGVLLLAVYVIIGMAFYFLPPI